MAPIMPGMRGPMTEGSGQAEKVRAGDFLF